jgi:vacuolar-type H+-ATPase subunit E/Vma4
MQTRTKIINLLAISLACGLASASGADEQSNIQKQREEAQQKARPEVEKQKQQAQSQAEKTLDKDALAAIEETGKAI